MLYRVCGGIFFLLYALQAFGVVAIPEIVVGIFALLAAIGLLAGI